MEMSLSLRFRSTHLLLATHILIVIIVCLLSSSTANTSSPSSSLSSSELEDVFIRALASNSTFGALARNLNLNRHRGNAAEVKTSNTTTSCLHTPRASPDDVAMCLVSKGQCVSLSEIASIYGLDDDSILNYTDTGSLSSALLFSIVSCDQSSLVDHGSGIGGEHTVEPPSSRSSWGYSFLFVTLINLCSLTGALVLPCMKLKIYKRVLMFMVALAVGTLAGSGLLFLIPEAFRLVHDGDTDYIWKATTITGGIYLFYLIEKLLRAINEKRENTKQKKRQDELATEGQFSTSFQRQTIHNTMPEKNPDTIPSSITNGICSSASKQSIPYTSVTESASSANFAEDNNSSVVANGTEDSNAAQAHLLSVVTTPQDKSYSNGGALSERDHGHGHSHYGVAPVAYMIIFGDALHNFIDGLSIGSAFTQSTMTGVSVSVAVLCEELPHELGDFAILLNSGLSIRKAILYNFMSACTCYLGTAIGIALGENTQSHEWIFAIAGGMFLYISLVDMLPEMNSSSESPEGKRLGGLKVFLIHNLGLLSGYSIMLVMALYSGDINFE